VRRCGCVKISNLRGNVRFTVIEIDEHHGRTSRNRGVCIGGNIERRVRQRLVGRAGREARDGTAEWGPRILWGWVVINAVRRWPIGVAWAVLRCGLGAVGS
jgi:hypothetical protein